MMPGAGGQLQRSAGGTCASTISTWAPQPAQDGFLHLLQVIARHMVVLLYQVEPAQRRRVRAIREWGVDCRGRWIARMMS